MADNVKYANRYGLDLKLYKANETDFETPLATIDFANEVSIELSSEVTWATGGQNHANRIAFSDPITGTLKISTQLVTMDLLGVISGNMASEGSNDNLKTIISFENGGNSMPKSYIIKGTTVWQDEDGTVYDETITAYKAYVKPNYSVTYNGSGDPQSLDVEFELGTDANGKVIDFVRSKQTSTGDE